MKQFDDDVFALLKKNISDVIPGIPPNNILPESSLRALGANSMDIADIIIQTLENLNLTTPLISFAKAKNIGELVNLIATKIS